MNEKSRTYFIRTYGCQMNVHDSERMAAILAAEGYTQSRNGEDADLVILNTCHIREKASEKVYSEIGRLKAARAQAPGRRRIAVAGCVAQAEGAEIVARAPVVDLVFGPQTFHRLPEYLGRLEAGEKAIVDTEFPAEDKFDHLPVPKAPAASPSAFLTIQEGCDKFCTFCVVPYTRGAEVSRPARRIVAEARALAARGVREITLLGQNVNAYHGEGPDGAEWTLGSLVFALAEIEGIARIRYTTSHPRDVDDTLLAAHRDLPELMPYLHLPVQSGSDRILAAMNRRHTAADYLRKIDLLRAARPDIAFSSDFITGFPGETEEDFEATMRLAREVEFAQAYSFKYSARPGTPAASLGAQVPEEIKASRLQRLQALLLEQQHAFNRASVGCEMPILIEKPGRHGGQLMGRSPWNQPVHFDGAEDAIGAIMTCRIDRVAGNSLFATPLSRPHGSARSVEASV